MELETQRERVLKAFQEAPGGRLTTGQLHGLGYLVNPRARVSELRKMGHKITCKHIAGTDSSMYTWHGKMTVEEAMEEQAKHIVVEEFLGDGYWIDGPKFSIWVPAKGAKA